jgi:adenine specific DNA methylase Mod
MKRIVIIVPDQIKMVSEGRTNNYSKDSNVTGDLIVQMLSRKTDYHENIFFQDSKSIRVESIEDFK